MQELAYRAFLPPQLHSLSGGGGQWVTETEMPQRAWEILGLEDRRWEKGALFAEPDYCKELIESLDSSGVEELTAQLCSGRWTHVPKDIRRFDSWEERQVPFDKIYLAAGDLPTKGVHDLESIVKDPAISASPRFNHLRLHDPVEFDLFVGLLRINLIRLIDGNHRAVHEARRAALGFSKSESLRVVIPTGVSL